MEKLYGWGFPIDISTTGSHIDRLIIVVHIFMAILFVGWLSFLIYTLVRFRARKEHQADYHTKHTKVPTFLEVGVAVFEVILLIGFAFPIWNTYRHEMPARDQALVVRVVAEQFAWNIHYPGPDKIFGKTDPKLVSTSNQVGLDLADAAGKDDVITINQLHVPVDTPVIVDLSSKDVIHSFFLPVVRVKMDTVPGQMIPVWFQATKEGSYQIACAQLCGLGHYRMRGFFMVDSKEKFETWMQEQLSKKVKA